MKVEDKEYLDSLDDEMFIAHILNFYGSYVPVWEKCSQKEYEKYNRKTDNNKLTIKDLQKFVKNTIDGKIYRAVPIYNNGGGILDQISGKKPDCYVYEKLTAYKPVLLLGGDMLDYCKTRECMKPFFDNK